MATADPAGDGGRRRRRSLLLFAGPLVVLAIGAVVIGVVLWADGPDAAPPEPDPVAVDADSVYEFTTVDEMVAASDLVVRARVVATERGALLGAEGADPAGAGVVVREVTLEVDEVWWRSPAGSVPEVRAGDVLVVAEEGWLASGEPLIVDGLAPSAVGDEGVWFLQALPDAGSGSGSGDDADEPQYLVINAQGRYLVDGDSLVGASGDDELVAAIEHLAVDELRSGVQR